MESLKEQLKRKMLRQINFDLTNLEDITNDVYIPYFECDYRTLVIKGSAGSGKSVFIAQKLVYRAIKERNHKFLVLRKVGVTLRDSVFEEIKAACEMFGLSGLYKPTVSPMQISIPILNTTFIFKGMDDKEKIKSIKGITGMWLEEATEFEEGDYNQLDLRLRGQFPFYLQIILSLNPIDPDHWIKKRFFDNQELDSITLTTTYLDNLFLDEASIRKIENLKNVDYYYYQVYALGEWGILQGKIFTNYKVEEFDESTFPAFKHGLDWGFSEDPLAYVKLYVDLTRKKLYVCDELYLYRTTNDQSGKQIKDKIGNDVITCDSAEPKSIQDYQYMGINAIGAKKGKGSIETGIRFIQSFEVIIHPRCVNTKKEFDKYKYKQDKNGNSLRDPIDQFNHIIDAIRYALEDMNYQGGSSSGLVVL